MDQIRLQFKPVQAPAEFGHPAPFPDELSPIAASSFIRTKMMSFWIPFAGSGTTCVAAKPGWTTFYWI